MKKDEYEGFEKILETLENVVETQAKMAAQAAEGLLESTKVFTGELMRFRAWESVLYLFFARYYSRLDDPMGAATWDRDFLAGRRRELADDEEGARGIEALYQSLFVMIEAGQRHKSALGRKDDDDGPVM